MTMLDNTLFDLPEPWKTCMLVGQGYVEQLNGRNERWAIVARSALVRASKELGSYYWRLGHNAPDWASPFANAACIYRAACGALLHPEAAKKNGLTAPMVTVVVCILQGCAQQIEELEATIRRN